MNQPLQPDLHPEAEILNAFAEHALTEPEQQQTLAHLAGCSRCRQIVFLAQEAAATEVHPIPAPVPTPSPIGHWWPSWRILWIAAPACAALLTIVIFLQLKPATSTTQQAGVANQPIQPTAPPASAISRSEAVEQSVEQKDSRLREKSISNTPLPAQSPRPVPNTLRNKERAAGALPRPSATTSTVNVTPESAAPALIVSAGAAQIEPAPQPIPPMPAPTSLITVNSSAASISVQPAPPAAAGLALKRQTIPSPRTAPAPPHAIPNASTRPGSGHAFASGVMLRPGIVNMNNSPMQRQAASALAEAVARSILYTKLPNGLTAVSTAAVFNAPAQHRVLALDTAGTLFRSEDAGTTWQPIAIQWTGRPLQIRTAQIPVPASPAPSSPSLCPTCARSISSAPAVKFELITDAVSTFTSTDGLNWTLKQEAPPQKSEPKK